MRSGDFIEGSGMERLEKRSLIRNLVYPVPDPRFPFLGVHFTRMVNGGVEAGAQRGPGPQAGGLSSVRHVGQRHFLVSLLPGLLEDGLQIRVDRIGRALAVVEQEGFCKSASTVDARADRVRPGQRRGRRASASSCAERFVSGRFSHRRSRLDDPCIERALARGHGLIKHRPQHRKNGVREIRAAKLNRSAKSPAEAHAYLRQAMSGRGSLGRKLQRNRSQGAHSTPFVTYCSLPR